MVGVCVFSSDRHQACVAASGRGVDADDTLDEQALDGKRWFAGRKAVDVDDRTVACGDLAGDVDALSRRAMVEDGIELGLGRAPVVD